MHNYELFRFPERLQEAQKLVERLEGEIRLLKAFEHTKSCLESYNLSYCIKKCAAFVQAVDSSAFDDQFYQEVSKLTLDELGFVSISFAERPLKVVQSCLQSSHVREYM